MIEFTLSKIGVMVFVIVLLYSLVYALKTQLRYQENSFLLKDCSNIAYLIERTCYTNISSDYTTNSITGLSVEEGVVTLSKDNRSVSRTINCPLSTALETNCYTISGLAEGVVIEPC